MKLTHLEKQDIMEEALEEFFNHVNFRARSLKLTSEQADDLRHYCFAATTGSVEL
jgi:hypothetical protein